MTARLLLLLLHDIRSTIALGMWLLISMGPGYASTLLSLPVANQLPLWLHASRTDITAASTGDEGFLLVYKSKLKFGASSPSHNSAAAAPNMWCTAPCYQDFTHLRAPLPSRCQLKPLRFKLGSRYFPNLSTRAFSLPKKGAKNYLNIQASNMKKFGLMCKLKTYPWPMKSMK